MLASLEGVFDARRVRDGQSWRLERTETGHTRAFEYEIDGRSLLRMAPAGGDSTEFTAEVIPYDIRTTLTQVSGRLDAATSSLFAAMEHAGEQPDSASRSPRSSRAKWTSTRSSAWRRVSSAGREGRAGRALCRLRPDPRGRADERWPSAPRLSFSAGRRTTGLLRRGRPIAQALLPAVAAQVRSQASSGFSRSRPASGSQHSTRPPRRRLSRAGGGARVAVSKGTVTFAGWTAGGGRTVRIRHASGYESGYLHLSAFGAGIPPACTSRRGN